MSKAKAIVNFGLLLMALCLPMGAATCDSLASLKLTNTSITAVQVVTAGTFQPPGAAPNRNLPPGALYRALPEFCRVQGVIQPTNDSHIALEVLLPAENWNGRIQAVGNGGCAGSINYGGLSLALREGYATASTDTGHKGFNAQFAVGHPEKLIDFAYRGVHEMAVQAKPIIAAFYGRLPHYAYWN